MFNSIKLSHLASPLVLAVFALLATPERESWASNEWTWMKGSDQLNEHGVYAGGTPSEITTPGGRRDAVSWTDSDGNLWLFGGYGYGSTGAVGFLEDLWRYDQSTKQWIWLKGSDTVNMPASHGIKGNPAFSNSPGGRQGAAGWTDNLGNFWLFGGWGRIGSQYGSHSDLWKFDRTVYQWVWVSGNNGLGASGTYGIQNTPSVNNCPGGRRNHVTWTDGTGLNFWLFGGEGRAASVDSGLLNDIWKYNVTQNTWVWVNGSNAVDQNGVYGILGDGDEANTPGARSLAATWVSQSGELWLFGGDGNGDGTGTPASGRLNDLWKFMPSRGAWIWVKGNKTPEINGVYGTQGSAHSSNLPGGRHSSVAWSDPTGRMWLLGGTGMPETGSGGSLDDLWAYDEGSNRWTWVKGTKVRSTVGVYGPVGLPSDTNNPGARTSSVGWRSDSDTLWLFGGFGRGSSTTTFGYLNDLWQYSILTPSGIEWDEARLFEDDLPM